MTEENKLIRTLNQALEVHTGRLIFLIGQVRMHIEAKEYYLATLAMTELTTTQAEVSMRLRSILVKNGYIESEL